MGKSKNISVVFLDKQIKCIEELCELFDFKFYISLDNRMEWEKFNQEIENTTSEKKSELLEKQKKLKMANRSKIIKYLLVCGYIRWQLNNNNYIQEIKKMKRELSYEICLRDTLPKDEDDITQCTVKIPIDFYKKLEDMKDKLKENLQNQFIYLSKPYPQKCGLLGITQRGIKKQVKNLSMTEFADIIIKIEIEKVYQTRKLLQDNALIKRNINVSFPMNKYILLCELFETCGFDQKELYYFTMINLFGNFQ